MTDREKAIVMAYTGICMLEGEKLNKFYEYMNELYSRPVYTHEFLTLNIKERSEKDFMELCRREEPEQRWIPCSERLPEDGERVLATHLGGINPDRQVIEHIYENGKFVSGWDMDMNIDSPTFGQRYMGNIIAWMPLPKPYMEEEE